MPGAGVPARHTGPRVLPGRGCPGSASRRMLFRMEASLHPIQMIDVGGKPITLRTATASGRLSMQPATLAAIRAGQLAKGDPIVTARLAGIMAAKRTADIIPLCHPLPLDGVDVALQLVDADESGSAAVAIEATVRATARTGVEMEALAAVTAAALTVYDMTKSLDRGMTIEAVRLETKTGGSRGDYHR
jgi:cyclic pyranopterin phosphate synthase